MTEASELKAGDIIHFYPHYFLIIDIEKYNNLVNLFVLQDKDIPLKVFSFTENFKIEKCNIEDIKTKLMSKLKNKLNKKQEELRSMIVKFEMIEYNLMKEKLNECDKLS